jgi:hypothetical protein
MYSNAIRRQFKDMINEYMLQYIVFVLFLSSVSITLQEFTDLPKKEKL